ncbi:MAG: hypothetical protein RR362_01715 [Raoultibacter sp.]
MDALKKRRLGRTITPYLLILPTVLLLVVFVYGVINGVMQGFGIMPFLGKTDFTFEYYLQVFSRPDLMSSMGYSLYLAGVSSVVALVGGTLLAAALSCLKASRSLQLLDIQIPLMTAHTLVVLFIVSIFAGSGLFPRLLEAVGIIDGMGTFSSVVGDLSGWGIILTYAWKEIPFIAFCSVALMSHISDRFGQAAAAAGASPVRTFFTVTLPLCKNTLVKAFLVVFAFAFGSYEVPFLLGPTVPKALPVLAYIEFQDPDILNRCYAMALNGTMALVCSVIALGYFIVMQREGRGR